MVEKYTRPQSYSCLKHLFPAYEGENGDASLEGLLARGGGGGGESNPQSS